MVVAIIPARGGSKRIARKNVKAFHGKPIIAWSILAAQESGLFDRILVSTDDTEIMDQAVEAGAEAPFRRPAELADDHTPTIPVIRHAVEWLQEHQGPVTEACCIYATAPFVRPGDLREGLRRLREQTETDFVLAVTHFEFPLFRAVRLSEGDRVSMFWPEHEMTRSQDLPAAYHDAGQFYWGTSAAWRGCSGVFSSNTRAVVVPRYLVQDIDTPEDWVRAEAMFSALRNV